ncbi:hypothetical protein PG985_014448 [Apiospora marii]|uniref:Rhodopsin domain-containing protein n=1 Tax=Apiospora marii TaxID=335849 RepID=A0ABR1R541_9PEZI
MSNGIVNVQTAQILDYVSSALSLAILLTRLALETWRKRKFDLNFYLASASVVAVVGRLVVTHYYLSFGAADPPGVAQDVDSKTYIAGRILVLVARVLFSLILWLQIGIILSFYTGLVHDVTVMTWVIRAIWGLVVVTFVAVVLVTFLECRPFSLYWSTDEPQPQCQKAYAQLLMQTSCNIFLDVVVLIIAFPLTRLSKHTWSMRLRVCALIGLGLLCIAISATRAAQTIEAPHQDVRAIWASIQIFVAVFVGNAPSIYGSVKLLRREKSTLNDRRYGAGTSSSDASSHPPLVGLQSIRADNAEPDADSNPSSTSS